jgi:bisphosphoglycerate-independent phosphoglycerate mutase (AlkP superfamily)
VDFGSIAEGADQFPFMNGIFVINSFVKRIERNKSRLMVCSYANVDGIGRTGNVTP